MYNHPKRPCRSFIRRPFALLSGTDVPGDCHSCGGDLRCRNKGPVPRMGRKELLRPEKKGRDCCAGIDQNMYVTDLPADHGFVPYPEKISVTYPYLSDKRSETLNRWGCLVTAGSSRRIQTGTLKKCLSRNFYIQSQQEKRGPVPFCTKSLIHGLSDRNLTRSRFRLVPDNDFFPGTGNNFCLIAGNNFCAGSGSKFCFVPGN